MDLRSGVGRSLGAAEAGRRPWIRNAVVTLATVTLAGLPLGLAGCSKPKPPPPPVPPPPPPGPVFTAMLLRTCGTGQFCEEGRPVDFRGAIPCCLPFEGGETGWPLFSREWLEYAQKQGRVNFFHVRPGPFNVADEADLAPVGGAYVEVDGKADLSRFNERFWEHLAALVELAGGSGAWVEVDLIDSWRLKGDCPFSAWNRGRNVQGQDHCITSHRGPGDETHDAYLRKLVQTVGRLGNVVWQIGNESANVSGKDSELVAWEQWVRDRVRHWEQEVGFGVVHMIATNSEFDEIEAAPFIDYVNGHGWLPNAPLFGKPTTNNETNPAPMPEAYLAAYCRARKGGAYVWYWRSGQTKAQMDRTLALISEASADNCAGVDTSDCPFDVRPTVSLSCKRFGTHGGFPLWDCTPKQANGNPVWPEGDPELRSACEQKSMGGVPTFALDPPLAIDHLAHGGLAFAVAGTGSSAVRCSIPNAGSFRGCVDAMTKQPLVVTVP
jgi:hypothetical protein